MKLRIFNQSYKRYDRYYNYFWDYLIYKLSQTHEIKEFRDRSTFHDNSGIELTQNLEDSDFLVLNEENDKFVIFSICDILQHHISLFKENENLSKIFLSQFYDLNIKANAEDKYSKFSPWIYFPCFVENLDQYYLMRKYREDKLKDILFFKGTVFDRPILEKFSKEILSDYSYCYSPQEYCKELIGYKVGLSLSGRGEFCYRDIEYMAMGLPFLRFQFQSEMIYPLIPNYHYISVEIPEDLPQEINRDNLYLDRMGDRHHAEILENKFLQVKDDSDLLEEISRNARKYYDDYLAPESSINLTLELIEKELI